MPETVRFDNYEALRDVLCSGIDDAPDGAAVEVSFEDRGHSGSIGVALMAALFRHAHAAGRTVSFVRVPVDLRNIIEVADLEDVLPLESSAEPSEALTEG